MMLAYTGGGLDDEGRRLAALGVEFGEAQLSQGEGCAQPLHGLKVGPPSGSEQRGSGVPLPLSPLPSPSSLACGLL
jgi:hypothetical protein